MHQRQHIQDLSLSVAEHPLLMLGGFVARLPAPLAELESPPPRRAALTVEAETPLPRPDDADRKAVRELLRWGGFKPSGRSKPASEFLLRAASSGTLDSINLAVDLCNVVSLHSGLPISVVDLDRVSEPLRVAIAAPGSSYVFNPAGQIMQLDGLLCLHDRAGPCANPVKDSQRSKTHAGTRTCLCLVWGTRKLFARSAMTLSWYGELHEQLGIDVRPVIIEVSPEPEPEPAPT